MPSILTTAAAFKWPGRNAATMCCGPVLAFLLAAPDQMSEEVLGIIAPDEALSPRIVAALEALTGRRRLSKDATA